MNGTASMPMRENLNQTIFYLVTLRLPTEKTYGINIVKTCAALARAGATVTLFIPRFRKPVPESVYEYYHAPETFSVSTFWFPDVVDLVLSLGFWLRDKAIVKRVVFSSSLFRLAFLVDQAYISARLVFLSVPKETIIYTRSLFPALALSLRRRHVFYDMHGFPYRLQWAWRVILRRLSGVTVTNKWKAGQCKTLFGIDSERVLVAPNGFDDEAFGISLEAGERPTFFGGAPRPIILYTGHLYDWKGAHVLADAAAHVPKASFVFIGGTFEDQESFKKTYHGTNIYIVGRRPHRDIPRALMSGDVLVLPNPGVSKDQRMSHYATFDTSPIKLFEYMASGVPIVATSVPSARELLNERNAFLVTPNDSRALADGIRQILENPAEGQARATKAKQEVLGYSWSARGSHILAFMKKFLIRNS